MIKLLSLRLLAYFVLLLIQTTSVKCRHTPSLSFSSAPLEGMSRILPNNQTSLIDCQTHYVHRHDKCLASTYQ